MQLSSIFFSPVPWVSNVGFLLYIYRFQIHAECILMTSQGVNYVIMGDEEEKHVLISNQQNRTIASDSQNDKQYMTVPQNVMLAAEK